MLQRISLPPSVSRALYLTLSVALTSLAIPIAWHFWRWSGLAIPFLWGATILLAMRFAIEQTPSAARERTASRVVSIGVKLRFFAFIFAPAIFPVVCADLIAALAWIWIIVLGFNISDVAYKRFRGHIRRPSTRPGAAGRGFW